MMEAKHFDKASLILNEQLVSVRGTSRTLTAKFENLSREAEGLKVEILARLLEEKRVSQARQIGLATVKQDGKILGIGLGLAVAGSFLQGVAGKNDSAALAAGISGFNSFLQGLGDSRWAVSLDKQFIVIPNNRVFAGRVWVTWESLHSAMQELKQKALSGEDLGGLDTVTDKLKHGWSKLVYFIVPPSPETRLGQWRRIN